jgi:hypothetical protein
MHVCIFFVANDWHMYGWNVCVSPPGGLSYVAYKRPQVILDVLRRTLTAFYARKFASKLLFVVYLAATLL